MEHAMIGTSENLNNHDLEKFAVKMTEILKLASIQAINSQMNNQVYKLTPAELNVGIKKTVKVPSVAMVVAERFNQLDSKVKEAVRLDLGRDKELTQTIHVWGVDIRSAKPVAEQIDLKRHFDFINGKNFSLEEMNKIVKNFQISDRAELPVEMNELAKNDLAVIASRYPNVLPENWLKTATEGIKVSPGGKTQKVINKGLAFRIHQVKCIDETNPEWAGNDEIAWGGAFLDSNHHSGKITEHYVGSGFHDGHLKNYNPPSEIVSFNIGDLNYPKTFLVALALAEKDSGGLSSFIQKLFEAIRAEIQVILNTLGAAAGSAIGSAIGGSVGSVIAGPLGAIIGAVAGAIIGALVAWLINALKDDIFAPKASTITLYSTSNIFPNGSCISPLMYFHYHGFGGHYRLAYDWQIKR